jgi:hypothetical protein
MRVTRADLLEWANFLDVREDALESFGVEYLNGRVRTVIKELREAAGKSKSPILGQEAICPDGLGRVVAFEDNFPEQWIQVDTYVDNRGCKWAPYNVTLIDPK